MNHARPHLRNWKRSVAVATCAVAISTGSWFAFGQTETKTVSGADVIGRPFIGDLGIQRTTAQIIVESIAHTAPRHLYLKRELEIPWRKNRPQDPNAQFASQSPDGKTEQLRRGQEEVATGPRWPQTVDTSFDGVTGPAETSAFPRLDGGPFYRSSLCS